MSTPWPGQGTVKFPLNLDTVAAFEAFLLTLDSEEVRDGIQVVRPPGGSDAPAPVEIPVPIQQLLNMLKDKELLTEIEGVRVQADKVAELATEIAAGTSEKFEKQRKELIIRGEGVRDRLNQNYPEGVELLKTYANLQQPLVLADKGNFQQTHLSDDSLKNNLEVGGDNIIVSAAGVVLTNVALASTVAVAAEAVVFAAAFVV